MAEIHVLVLLVLCVVCVECAGYSVKELYCRDPVTGKLHAVNTTWPSSTFCGNYTCKIRKRNTTQTNLIPIREFNVTKLQPAKNQEVHTKNAVTIEKKLLSDIIKVIHKNDVERNNIPNDITKLQPKINNMKYLLNPIEEKHVHKPTKLNSRSDGVSVEDHDRFLTEEEINSIAEILHTVKKSDLDALVEIYDLAQDIYTEIHKVTDEELAEAAMNIIKEDNKHNKFKSSSYWYDPLHNKEKVTDIDLDLQETMGKTADPYDLELQDSHTTQKAVKPEAKLQTLNDKLLLPTYYNGAFVRSDFGKLPYLFPMSPFHRMSSYIHKPTQPVPLSRRDSVAGKNTPCTSKTDTHNQRIPERITETLIQPSFLLPYPFTNIPHYNISDYPMHFYYGGRPWAWDYYNRYRYYEPYFKATAAPKAILVNQHLADVQDIELGPVRNPMGKNMLHKWVTKSTENPDWKSGALIQDWKTDPLSAETLKDIRANVDTSRLIKTFPFRKKVYLEKVGKVKRTDKVINKEDRNKRSPDKESEEANSGGFWHYETYLENVTCTTEVKLGYFRVGNMSHPYPACCPQLIDPR